MLNFDGAQMSSDAGLTLLREVERRHDLAGLLSSCLTDLRDPGKTRHSLDDIIRFRIMMIAAGYEDGNDACDLRHDPSFKLALERDPETGTALCSQPTISRMENLADTRALIRMAREMVRFYCASFARAPGRIVLDIDDTFDPVHGHRQLRLSGAYYDEYGFQPIVVFDGDGRLVGAVLRPARRPTGKEAAAHIRRLIRQVRRHWPTTEILLRADSHYGTPEVLDLCDRLGLSYVFGLSKNARLREHVQSLEASTADRYARKGERLRRFKSFSYAARSWSKERVAIVARTNGAPMATIARVEVGPLGRDTRFIVTNLTGPRGKHLYERVYSARGQAENHIKGWKSHLASDRTSCMSASANQMRVRRAYAAPPGPRSRLTAARLRLLALVDVTRGLPKTLAMAARPVRHVAPASGQAGCDHRREENPDRHDPASLMPAPEPHPPPVRRARAATPGMTPTIAPRQP
jgi:hypothetical protein